MSTICIGVSDKNPSNIAKECCDDLQVIAQKYGCGIFFELEYREPFLSHYEQDAFVFSLADSFSCDNCEMLMLPDGWTYNGQESAIPFEKRMQLLVDIATLLHDKLSSVEFFIGHSGEAFEDFTTYYSNCKQLTERLSILNSESYTDMNLHIIVL